MLRQILVAVTSQLGSEGRGSSGPSGGLAVDGSAALDLSSMAQQHGMAAWHSAVYRHSHTEKLRSAMGLGGSLPRWAVDVPTPFLKGGQQVGQCGLRLLRAAVVGGPSLVSFPWLRNEPCPCPSVVTE